MTAAATIEDISFRSAGKTLEGRLALPSGNGPHPGVVIIHESWGLNDNIRGVAERFAAEGYVGFAVDLFAGSNRAVCLARFFSGTVLNSLDHGGIHDLKAALDHLQQRPEVDPERVGAIGFCMGGSFAIGWACTDDRLKAIAPYYAQNPRPLKAVERLCPVVGSYPAWDFTARDARRLDQELDGYGVDHDIKVYPRARHSFFDETGWAYNAAASDDSWKRVLSFFAEHLKQPTSR